MASLITRALVSLAVLVGLACGPASSRRAETSKAILVIACPQSDAEVWIDGEYLRVAKELRRGVRLPIGRHRVEVRHDRFHSMYYEVELAAGERRTLQVELAARLP